MLGMAKVKSRSHDPDADAHMTYCCIVFVRAPSIGILNFHYVASAVLKIAAEFKIQNYVT